MYQCSITQLLNVNMIVYARVMFTHAVAMHTSICRGMFQQVDAWPWEPGVGVKSVFFLGPQPSPPIVCWKHLCIKHLHVGVRVCLVMSVYDTTVV